MFDLVITEDQLLREKHWGKLQAYPLTKIAEYSLRSGVDRRSFRPEGGENWIDLGERVRDFFVRLYCENVVFHIDRINKDDRIIKSLTITHEGWIREMYNLVNYCIESKQPEYFNVASANCSIHGIMMYCQNTGSFCKPTCKGDTACMNFKILIKNDTTHLKQY